MLLVSQGASKTPVNSRRKIPVRKDISLEAFDSSHKPSFFYLQEIDPERIRANLKITGTEKQMKAYIKAIKNKKNAFRRIDVSYAAILSNLKSIEEWKKTQRKIQTGKVKNVQMAKLNMEERVRKMRLELIRKYGTPEEYQQALEAFRKFESFKVNFLLNKGVKK